METPTTDRRDAREEKGSNFLARHVVAIVLFALAVVFIAENRSHVHLRVIGPQVTMPVWEALTATFVAGMLVLLLAQRRRRK